MRSLLFVMISITIFTRTIFLYEVISVRIISLHSKFDFNADKLNN